jgi:hypothetical protein
MGASPGSLAKTVGSALIKGLQRTFDPGISAEQIRVQPTDYKDYLSVQVVSPRFEGMDADERTDAVTSALDAEKVPKQVQNKISMVLTFTPEEHREYVIIESGPSIDQIRRAIQRFARQHKKNVVIVDMPQNAGQFRLCSVVACEDRSVELDYWDLISLRGSSLRSYLFEKIGPVLRLPKRAFNSFPAVVGDESVLTSR